MRDKCMVRYASLVKQRLGSFVACKLKHILRDMNEKANALAIVATSILIKEMVFFNVHY